MKKQKQSSSKLTTADVKRRLEEDPDFVHAKRFGFSLERLLERYPEGAPIRIIASALFMTEDDVEIMHKATVEKLRKLMGVE